MNKQSINLDVFEKIQKVEVPPFLLTRIQQKIDNLSSNTINPKLVWFYSLAFILVIALNIMVLTNSNRKIKQETDLVQTMNLMPNNALYQ